MPPDAQSGNAAKQQEPSLVRDDPAWNAHWYESLHFRLTGRWPRRIVRGRMALFNLMVEKGKRDA